MKQIMDALILAKKVKERNKLMQNAAAVHLKAKREADKLSQEEAAEQCDVSPKTITRIENGQQNFTLKMALKICVGMGLTLHELLGDYVDQKII